MLGTFDDPGELNPNFHIFVKDQLPWICFGDEYPRYQTTPNDGKI
jgi:hypothetical protein